jgi:hypothetical protein
MSRIRQRLSYANVISTICLFLLVGGGTAFAASQIAKESIGAKAIKKESIGPGKLTKAAKAALEGQKGPTGPTGPAGPAGAAGPQGPAGSARAFGWTDDNNGTLLAAKSKNATVRHPEKGVYCVVPGAGIDPATATLLVSPDFTGSGTSKTIAQVREDGSECNAGGGLIVRLWNDGAAIDAQFSFLIP